jgi:hypothetical protein
MIKSDTNLIKKFIIVILPISIIIPLIVFIYEKPFGGFFLAGTIWFINKCLLNTDGAYLIFGNLLEQNIPCSEIFIYLLHSTTAISFDTLQGLPINLALIAIALCSLAYTIFKEKLIALSIAGIFLLKSFFDVADCSIFVKGSGIFFYVIFVILLVLLVKRYDTRFISLLFIIFVANHFFDYTAEMWMVGSLLVLIVLDIATYTKKSKLLILLFAVMLITFLMFRTIIYKGYIPIISLDNVILSISNFLLTIPIFANNAISLPYQYSNPSPPILFTLNFVFFIIVFLVTILCTIFIVYKLASRKPILFPENIFMLLITPALLDIIIYLPRGLFKTGFIVLMFPLLSCMSLFIIYNNITKRKCIPKIIYSYLLVLLLLGFASYAATIAFDVFPPTSNTDMDKGINWLIPNSGNELFILSDLDTLGKLNIANSETDKNIYLKFLNSTLYSNIVSPLSKGELTNIDYIMIDLKTIKSAKSIDWINFVPLGSYRAQISNNYQINAIYTDGLSEIFRPSSKA